MRLLTTTLLLTLSILMTACTASMTQLPDLTRTGQLLVTYQPESVGLMLTEGACEEALEADPIATAEEGVTARLYYALPPGAYCLTWGPRTGPTTFTAAGMRPVEIQAGALELVTLVGPEPRLVPG